MKTQKQVWLLKETVKLIKGKSKEEGLNHSEFIEKCILNYLKSSPKKHKIKKHTLTEKQLRLLKFIKRMGQDPITIKRLENVCSNGYLDLTKRSIRDLVPYLFNKGYIKEVFLAKKDYLNGIETHNKKSRYYLISRKGLRIIDRKV